MGAAQTPDVVVILGLLVIVAVVAAVVRYVRIPYTVALVLAGLALALLPDVPRVQLTPSMNGSTFEGSNLVFDIRVSVALEFKKQ